MNALFAVAGVQGRAHRQDPDPEQSGDGRAGVVLPEAAARHQRLPGDPDGRHRGHGRRRHDGHPRPARPRRARAEHPRRVAAHGRLRGPLHRLHIPEGPYGMATFVFRVVERAVCFGSFYGSALKSHERQHVKELFWARHVFFEYGSCKHKHL